MKSLWAALPSGHRWGGGRTHAGLKRRLEVFCKSAQGGEGPSLGVEELAKTRGRGGRFFARAIILGGEKKELPIN